MAKVAPLLVLGLAADNITIFSVVIKRPGDLGRAVLGDIIDDLLQLLEVLRRLNDGAAVDGALEE